MKKKGFTLVELLAVIAILAILVIIALPNVMGMFRNAKKNSFLTEVKEIYKTAQQQWMMDSMMNTNAMLYGRVNNALGTGCSKMLDMSGRTELDYIVNLATKYLGKCNFICTSYNASWLDYIRSLGEDYALAYYGGDGIVGTNRYTNKSRLTPRTTGVNYYGTAQAKLDAFIAYNEYAKSGNTEMDCDMRGDPILFNQALDLGCRVFFCYNDPPLFTDNEISSEYGWDKFNYTGQLENDILNLDTSQYISKTVNIDSSYGAICIYLRFKGSININVDGNSKTATYEDWNEWCFSYMMSKGETGEKTVLITALEPSSIYYLKVCYKNV